MGNKINSFADLFTLSWGFGGQRILATAARTGILGHLAQHRSTAAEIAKALKLDELATGKILRALHASGLTETEDERYALNPELREIFLPGEKDVTPFVAHSDGLNNFWGATLEDWVRTGEHPHRMRDAEAQKKFGAAMKAIASHLAPRVVDELDFSTINNALDLGGGIGFYAATFCKANPKLKATVIEHPEVCKLGEAEAQKLGLSDRIEFQGGNYLEDDLGEGYDLILLANVLHQESAENAEKLVERAAAALAPGGRLAVVDFVIDEERRENLVGALFAVNMRGFGDTYPESVIRGWMDQAGLETLPPVNLEPAHWLLIGQRH